ncbi:hypothetical protein A2115_01075 [Candidatus Woesebacteria bacterium GWA1_41_8]|jgi:ribonuclease HI|uniref:RNase H type-1 domain-containing protein n=1 Tax=Candidatus Woesebacteria bacterium GWA1_41_8 TaxID=1802471 RepID=A0A1F7WID7_9BACT|nr:MAG: hypothetical protein A2115_01075 [Candidatus Woesebacteria bacterium GWA1_41_8]
MQSSSIEIFSDGGSRGNPGPAAAAFVVYDKNGVVLHKEKKYLGVQTNNFAEYTAVVMALTWLNIFSRKFSSVVYYLDSELVVRQLTGVYKIKNKNLIGLFNMIKKLQKGIKIRIDFQHVPRTKNKVADRLVNEAIDEN